MNWRELHPDLWCADEDFNLKGLQLGARMTVVRLQNDELILISPLHFSQSARQKLSELGEVKFLIAPNKFHHLDLPTYAHEYPQAQIYDAPYLRAASKTPWRVELDQTIFRGNALEEEIVFFHRASRTLILTDLCFNVRRHDWLSRLFGLGDFGPSRLFRLMTRKKNVAHASVRRILEWDFNRVIVAHGDVVESEGKARFRESFAWLL